MKVTRLAFSLLCSLAVIGLASATAADAPAAAAPRAVAEYVAPENFTDFRDGIFASEKGRQHLMEALNDHLVWLGRTYIPVGQRLELRFTNIDLAGDFEPWRGPSFDDIRIVKDIYAPRMEFDYRLVDAATGAVVRQGSEKISDLGYLMSSAQLPTHDQLRYDKQMLTDWARREFRRAKK
ncbi:MAG: hypothetical protein C0518_08975 [Opitutus sp.]|nr:hypothetical protein [Opitutus sp.]